MGKGQRPAHARGTQYEVSGLRPHVHLVAWPCAPMCGRNRSHLFCQCRLFCQSVCGCVRVSPSLSEIRAYPYLNRRPSNRECPAIKPPPTFCLLLRALDRGRPRTMDRAQSSNWGFLRGVLDRIRGTLRSREVELSTFEPDVVGSMPRRDRLVALRNKRRSCGGVVREVRSDRVAQ